MTGDGDHVRLLRPPGRPAERLRRADPQRLPSACPPVPPRREQGRRRVRALQADHRGVRDPHRPAAPPALRHVRLDERRVRRLRHRRSLRDVLRRRPAPARASRPDARRRPADGDRDRPPGRGAGARARHQRASPRDLRALPRQRRGAGLLDLDVRDLQRPRRGTSGAAVGVRTVRERLHVPALRRLGEDRRQALRAVPRRGQRAQGPRDLAHDPAGHRRWPAAARRRRGRGGHARRAQRGPLRPHPAEGARLLPSRAGRPRAPPSCLTGPGRARRRGHRADDRGRRREGPRPPRCAARADGPPAREGRAAPGLVRTRRPACVPRHRRPARPYEGAAASRRRASRSRRRSARTWSRRRRARTSSSARASSAPTRP